MSDTQNPRDANDVIRDRLVDEISGHLPPDDWAREGNYLIRRCARWGFEQVVAPLVDMLDDIYQTPGVAHSLGDELHERLRATLNGEVVDA